MVVVVGWGGLGWGGGMLGYQRDSDCDGYSRVVVVVVGLNRSSSAGG